MTEKVLDAVMKAFATTHVQSELVETGGRVFGSVTVKNSPKFDSLDDLRRQQLLWQKLREELGADALLVGPVVLEPTNRG